jgi:uncharacterized protein (TIRG00374 family)
VILGVLLLLMTFLLVLPRPLVRGAERAARLLPEKAARLVVDVLEAFLDGLKVFQSPALLVKAVVWSVAIWLLQSLSFWVAFLAFGIHVGFDVALFVNATTALAVAVPAAPGFIGTFQAGVMAGLGVYGVAEAAAIALSLGFHLAAFFPVTLVGFFYAWKLGFSLGDVGRSEVRVEEAVEEAHSELAQAPGPSEAGG